ncbi:hypothetical protein TrispH2_008850 [Trichoplax sp. H2]|nr:hypothetical protein TrispH2_008850 [Trichoplax sp. H2]|eukprot:RDD39976.1 hypothetical protein TrispH2_008850 [Trichoplax sp. H2]
MTLNWSNTELKLQIHSNNETTLTTDLPTIFSIPPSTILTVNCVMVVLMLLSLICNLRIIDVLIRDRLRQRHYDYFIINITLSNIVLTFGNLIYFIVLLVTFHQHFGITTLFSFCKFILVIQLLPYSVHMITLSLISFAQHRRLRHPYRNRVSTQFITSYTIPLIWIISLTLAMPILPLSDPKTSSWLKYHQYYGFYCYITTFIPSYRRIYFSIYVTVAFILPIIMIIYSGLDALYIFNKTSITMPVHYHNSNHELNMSLDRCDGRKREYLKICKKIIGLPLISCLAACPQAFSFFYMAYTTLQDTKSPTDHHQVTNQGLYFYISQFIILFNCYYHPVYFLLHDQKLRRRLCCLCYYLRQ